MLLLAELHYFPVILIHKYSQHLSDRQTDRERKSVLRNDSCSG